MKKSIFNFTLTLALGLNLALGSPGDDLDEFEDCIYQCDQISCNKYPYHIIQSFEKHTDDSGGVVHAYNSEWKFREMPLPIYLRLLFWDCEQNCDYQCQRIITQERIDRHEEVYQFHGKWPFLRVLGIQEIVSVAFSIGNLIVHLSGLFKVLSVKKIIREKCLTQFYVILFSCVITIFAWVFSSIFHTRDFLTTERLDYFAAGLTVLSGFYNLVVRYFRLFLRRRLSYFVFVTSICVFLYSMHIHRLVTDWSYTYNMQANISIGVLQDILLILLCFDIYSHYYERELQTNCQETKHLNYITFDQCILPSFFLKSSKLFSLYPLLLSSIVILGMSLEIFDFPPIFQLIDAHALWHFVTIIPVFYGWYEWMIWDLTENVRNIAMHFET